MTEKTGVNLLDYKLTPLQAALIEWGKAHPHGKLRELQFQDGVPVKADVYTEDGTGTESVLFHKIARKAKLI